MASIAMLIGGALANALGFTGSSYLFHRLSGIMCDNYFLSGSFYSFSSSQ